MLIDVVVPSAGESISEVDIAEWRKTEGAAVQRDDTLVVIETDKATLEIPAPESGTLTKILKNNGESAGVGEVIGKIEADKVAGANGAAKEARAPKPEITSTGETSPQTSDAAEAEREAQQISAPAEPEPAGEDEPASAASTERLAPSLARERREPAASGQPAVSPATESDERAPPPDGQPFSRERRQQVDPRDFVDLRARDKTIKPPARDGRREEAVPLSALRRRIAQRLVQAQQTAALLTTFNEIDMARVAELREQHRQAFEQKHQVKLGIMSFFIKAAVAALRAAPEINAELRVEQVVYRNYYDIGIAVGGGKGLVVPVLRDAEHKSFAEIEIAIADFARRARDARLNPVDLEGGTFTITNGGVYGSLLSTPIVNPPQTAILGMHAIQERPVARGGVVVVRPMMYVALTYDHRLVDGREAVTFLKYLKDLVEEPTRLLFEI
jgi:2-oxoglutarate dehydrogenase E2 component (dihydrolipoamide succinyltransferase)